jgi:hypothetical protein
MKLFSLPILAALALACVSASAETAPTSGKPAAATSKGLVNIVCNPSCDDVVIGGRSYGPSPVVRAEVPAGSHEVTLKRKDQADTRKQLVVTASQTASFSFTLTNQAPPAATPPPEMAARLASHMRVADGWLTIQCDPGCDDVVVDGKRSLGRNFANVALPPGEHEITGKRKGAPDKTIKVRVLPGQTTALRLGLSISAPGQIDPVAMRGAIEKKLAGGTATQEEVKLLRAICLQQNDKACVAKMDARLTPAKPR